jgi:NADH-quinone oxidoreductase subunit K
MHVAYPVVFAALLFSVGVYGVLARRNAILVLMSVELMLNAVNLNLVTFDVYLRDALHSGQTLALFVIVVAAAEVGLGLAIVLLVFRNRQTIAVDELRELAEVGRTAARPTTVDGTAGQPEAGQPEGSGPRAGEPEVVTPVAAPR